MAKKNNGKDFLFSDDCGFINGADGNAECICACKS